MPTEPGHISATRRAETHPCNNASKLRKPAAWHATAADEPPSPPSFRGTG
ncbi:predicted protein [Plenodomus lingam JN3]|uniref:Predicted protein n=1 Tax=Leptosphaeria maculans (strain JN3 / isolate v23.1.3 / race Av1-4-5-6-7-8) TaxID=985895 RepID=E5A3B9_LEPMJ|nr:predicted protein [Plenodomus lingam JN3]CBX98132.1 predicted protein [Plenodomus lingam JN3]